MKAAVDVAEKAAVDVTQAAGPCFMLQKPLPMRTLLVPQLLVVYILYDVIHMP